jgi:hypothetical protein
MGRPINKKYFGPPTAAGNEIKVRFYDGSTAKPGWIIKQLGTKKFRVTDGVTIKDCKLVTEDAAQINAEGEMSITVKNDAGNAVQVAKITAHLIVDENGQTIPWGFADFNAVSGQVEMEEAGDDTTMTSATTDEDDFENEDPAP